MTGDGSPWTDRFLLPAIVMLAAVAYVLTTPDCVLGGDNGEFATLFATGGIAHPPGYPAMVLWLRAFHWLPAVTPAKGAALATVPLGVAAVYLLQRACLAWGASIGATAVASLVFALSPVAWRMSCQAEAFAMSDAIAAAILWLSAPPTASERGGAGPPLAGPRLVVGLGLLAGLGMANQQSIVFLAPVGLLAAARGARRSPRPGLAALVGGLALMLGLVLPYAYVFLLARTADTHETFMWMEGRSLAAVWFHLRRGAYGSFRLGSSALPRQPLANLLLFAKACLQHTLGMPIIVLLALGRWALARPRGPMIRSRLAALGALSASLICAGPLFIASFNLPIDGVGPRVAERFYVLPELILTVLAALALDGLVPSLLRRSWIVLVVAGEAAIAAAVVTVPEVVERSRPTVQRYVLDTLRTLPPDAILVGTGDSRLFGFAYAYYALRVRRDVVYYTPELQQHWYREKVGAEIGMSLETATGGPVGPKTLAGRLLASGRPLFYTDLYDPKLASTLTLYPLGTSLRALPQGEPVPDPETLERMNASVLATYDVEHNPPRDPGEWGFELEADYARPWLALADAYQRAGEDKAATRCSLQAVELAPRLRAPP